MHTALTFLRTLYVCMCMSAQHIRTQCMHVDSEKFVGGANSIKFNSTYFSARVRLLYVQRACMCVCVYVNVYAFDEFLYVKFSASSILKTWLPQLLLLFLLLLCYCLSGVELNITKTSPENLSLTTRASVCERCSGGMATVCVLIGSFNNHPKWQTIG